MKWHLLLLAGLIFTSSCHKKETYPGIYQLLKRVIPEKADEFILDSIPQIKNKDVFTLESDGKTVRIGASSPTAAAMSINYYLKHYCHCLLTQSGNPIILPKTLPRIPSKIILTTPFQWRYYFNYCTYSYSMAYWNWNDWQKELDWMALNGINMPLAIMGSEAVWQKTLCHFGFSQKEILDFIPGPAYTAWWLMGNLEGWGGPVTQQWIDQREMLQKKVVSRMRELGMEPVFQGFYTMVPALLKKKYPTHHILSGGNWANFDSNLLH